MSDLTEYLTVSYFTLDDIEVAANGEARASYAYSAPSGYSTVGVVGVTTNNSAITLVRCTAVSGTISFVGRNVMGYSCTINPIVWVLFKKN